MNNRKAFTLIELLVVVAIITLLMAILIPSLMSARRQASVVHCGSNLRQIGTAVAMYTNDYNGKLPPWGQPKGVPNPIPGGQTPYNYISQINGNYLIYGSASNYTWADGTPDRWIGLGRLYGTSYIKDGRVFFCPTGKSNTMISQWPNYGRMNPDDPNNPAPSLGIIRTNYTYRSGANTQWEFPQIANAVVAGSKFIAADYFTSNGAGWGSPLNHDVDGFNVLGAQGNVVWHRGMPDNGVWYYLDQVYRKFDRAAGDTDSGSVQRDWALP